MNVILTETDAETVDKCYVCHGTRVRLICDHAGFAHLVCDDCHLMRLHPKHFVPGARLYTDAYFNGQMFRETKGKMGYADSYTDLTTSHRTLEYSHYIDEIMGRHGLSRGTLRVLDVGCGYGGFLKLVKERCGDSVEVHGIEVTPEVCDKASSLLDGAYVHCIDLKISTGELPQDYFDVSTMLDVIEHLDDPRLYLRSLAKCVKKGAILLLSTPNIESLNARLYSDNWVLHGAPGHMYYFGPRSIQILLKQTGWKIVDLYTERTIFHNERHGMETWHGKISRALFQNSLCNLLTNRLMRIGSIMTAVAQRD